jgi:Lipase (class 3)
MVLQVHEGFLQAYDSVHQQILSTVDEIVNDGSGERWWVMVTGHSLGGALATLCAYELAIRRYTAGPPPPALGEKNKKNPTSSIPSPGSTHMASSGLVIAGGGQGSGQKPKSSGNPIGFRSISTLGVPFAGLPDWNDRNLPERSGRVPWVTVEGWSMRWRA